MSRVKGEPSGGASPIVAPCLIHREGDGVAEEAEGGGGGALDVVEALGDIIPDGCAPRVSLTHAGVWRSLRIGALPNPPGR